MNYTWIFVSTKGFEWLCPWELPFTPCSRFLSRYLQVWASLSDECYTKTLNYWQRSGHQISALCNSYLFFTWSLLWSGRVQYLFCLTSKGALLEPGSESPAETLLFLELRRFLLAEGGWSRAVCHWVKHVEQEKLLMLFTLNFWLCRFRKVDQQI